MIENFQRVFLKTASKQKAPINNESVPREEFLINILEDSYFAIRLDQIVRQSLDGETESLDFIMDRINKNHFPNKIEFQQFLSFFTRRGKLRDSEKLIFQYKDLNKLDDDVENNQSKYFFQEDDDDNLVEKKLRLDKELKEKLVYKENKVRKGGKGKFDLTVPILFEF